MGRKLGPAPRLRLEEARASYHKLARAIRKGLVSSCHDVSDGGLWVALAESALGGDAGALISLDPLTAAADCPREPARLLFSESPSRFLVSVAPEAEAAWRRAMRGAAVARIGQVTADGTLRVAQDGQAVAAVTLEQARAAWKGEGRTWRG